MNKQTLMKFQQLTWKQRTKQQYSYSKDSSTENAGCRENFTAGAPFLSWDPRRQAAPLVRQLVLKSLERIFSSHLAFGRGASRGP